MTFMFLFVSTTLVALEIGGRLIQWYLVCVQQAHRYFKKIYLDDRSKVNLYWNRPNLDIDVV